jgi:hypothetical protein
MEAPYLRMPLGSMTRRKVSYCLFRLGDNSLLLEVERNKEVVEVSGSTPQELINNLRSILGESTHARVSEFILQVVS